MKLTKGIFKELYSFNITKKRYNEIINCIEETFGILMHGILTTDLKYYNFGDDYDGEESHFDPKFKDDIEVCGEFLWKYPLYMNDNNDTIPTRFLWEGIEKIEQELIECENRLQKEIDERKMKQKKFREDKKKKKILLIESIKEKLTLEEFKICNFKELKRKVK